MPREDEVGVLQSQSMETVGLFLPSLPRVFFLNVPLDSVMERLTLRRTDPVTGDRWVLGSRPMP